MKVWKEEKLAMQQNIDQLHDELEHRSAVCACIWSKRTAAKQQLTCATRTRSAKVKDVHFCNGTLAC
eukprot:1927462-Amphidinium_carterae.1